MEQDIVTHKHNYIVQNNGHYYCDNCLKMKEDRIMPTFLKRNHILNVNDKGSDFNGEWVVVPKIDFDFAINSHEALLKLAQHLADNPYSLTPDQWASEALEVIVQARGK